MDFTKQSSLGFFDCLLRAFYWQNFCVAVHEKKRFFGERNHEQLIFSLIRNENSSHKTNKEEH